MRVFLYNIRTYSKVSKEFLYDLFVLKLILRCFKLLFWFPDVFKETKSRYKQIDIVCNNAGIMHEGRWEDMVNINVVRERSG